MKTALLFFFVALALGSCAGGPRVELETSRGAIVVELEAERAPETVASFLDNVDSGFYDGTIFHRVIPGFMIQGGGFTPEMTEKPTAKSLVNEATNGLANDRGTIAMARKNAPHTASVQFFINLADNASLDHQSQDNGRTWGYAVFGRVIEGMEVVDAIARVPTARRGGHANVPLEPVTIFRARRLD